MDFWFISLYLTLTLLSRKSGIAQNHALFGVKLFCPKFGLCKENDILQLCGGGGSDDRGRYCVKYVDCVKYVYMNVKFAQIQQ